MNEITREYAKFFLDNQDRLFDFPVAGDVEEAMEFLEDCMAMVFDHVDELIEYLDENGMDIMGMTEEEILDSSEVFQLPDGKLLLVEA